MLVQSLPTPNAALRMRLWRALRAAGCAVLRDGVYLLPAGAEGERLLSQWAEEIVEAGGNAHLLQVRSTDERQAKTFEKLFDRTEDYAKLIAETRRFQAELLALEPPTVARSLKALRKTFEEIVVIDYFPGPAREQAAQVLAEIEAAAMTILSPDEPHAAAGAVQRRDRSAYQGRTWATRKRPWVDRLASAWLIRRFIDSDARILWLEKPSDCPVDAVGFDFDGAVFTHIGARVTFEVLLTGFNLEHDPALVRLGTLIHYLDVGGVPAPEASGLETVVRGLRLRCATDDELLAKASETLDCLYAAFAEDTANLNTKPAGPRT